MPSSQLCVALLLRAEDDVSDDHASRRNAFDLRWKVALGIDLEEQPCAKSTLQPSVRSARHAGRRCATSARTAPASAGSVPRVTTPLAGLELRLAQRGTRLAQMARSRPDVQDR
ncbi:MAG: hypothetical protein IPM29_32200 [Planctomycetes bacterium]|nr:hypothetical protein [Planctomycetota bacterium]